MTNIKSFTDLEQSKKLAEILPLESADMWYSYYGNPKYNPTIAYEGEQWFLCQIRNSYHVDIPCWSLARLLSVLPISINTLRNGKWNAMVQYDGKMIYEDAYNPVDACVEVILKLHELKVL